MTGPPTAETALECSGLSRSFGKFTAVQDVSFAIEKGSVLALLGHNGAGKTTTIRLLNGVLNADRGSASVLGFDPFTQGDELRRHTGVLTEIAGLDDRLTARENLLTSAKMRGLSGAALEQRVGELLEQFEMGTHADSQCQGFSTGQRRRVAIARSLIHNPEILFLDEPTSGLDPAGSQAVMNLISSYATEQNRTVVLCTHFLAEAGDLADYMCLMNQGRIEVFGRPNELAEQLWPDLELDLDLGGPLDTDGVDGLVQSGRVLAAVSAPYGTRVRVSDRDQIPSVCDWMVTRGYSLFGVQAIPKSLEDVYFAYQPAKPLAGQTDALEKDIGPAFKEPK